MGKIDTNWKKPVRKTQSLAAVDMQSLLTDDAGSGMEAMGAEDFAVPRLSILQALSPAVNKRDDNYVQGAEVGMIHDNVSGMLYDGQEGILMVLVSYRRSHLGWWPRDSKKGKGFVADFGTNPSILNNTKRNEKGQNLTPEGYEIIPTAEYFGFLIDEETGGTSRVLIPMSKTQIQKAKRINTIASSLLVNVNGTLKPAPLFYRAFRLKTKPESNDKGNWFGWDPVPGPFLTLEGLVTKPADAEVLENGVQIYMQARAFKQAVAKGEVKVAAPMADADTDDEKPM
jgi:hypothetical protein